MEIFEVFNVVFEDDPVQSDSDMRILGVVCLLNPPKIPASFLPIQNEIVSKM